MLDTLLPLLGSGSLEFKDKEAHMGEAIEALKVASLREKVMFDEKTIGKMKKNAYLINTDWGGVFDTTAWSVMS